MESYLDRLVLDLDDLRVVGLASGKSWRTVTLSDESDEIFLRFFNGASGGLLLRDFEARKVGVSSSSLGRALLSGVKAFF